MDKLKSNQSIIFPESLLITKLTAPQNRQNLIVRDELIRQMDEGFLTQPQIVVITAPAGFGKTTLVAEWLKTNHMKFAWFTLDKGDNDSSRFSQYVAASLQKASADIGKSLSQVIISPTQISEESIAASIINDISATPDAITLVLDDYYSDGSI